MSSIREALVAAREYLEEEDQYCGDHLQSESLATSAKHCPTCALRQQIDAALAELDAEDVVFEGDAFVQQRIAYEDTLVLVGCGLDGHTPNARVRVTRLPDKPEAT